MSDATRSAVDAGPGVLSRTLFAVRSTIRRRDTRFVIAGIAFGYLITYLWVIGHLAFGAGGVELFVVENPLARFFRPSLGPFSFTPVARLRLGPVTYLASFNTVLGFVISLLVGLNVAITYLAWRQPKACGMGSSSAGLLAGIPALLSGTACCGPIILFVLGIQASGVLLTAFDFLVPAAFLMLLGSLLLVGRQVDPEAIRSAGRAN